MSNPSADQSADHTTRKQVLRLARLKKYQLPGGAPNKSLIARTTGVTRTRVQQILASVSQVTPVGTPRPRIEDRPRKAPGAPDARAQVEKLAGQAQYQHQGGAPNKTLIARAAGVTRARVGKILASPEPKKRGRPRLPAVKVADLAELPGASETSETKKKRGRPRKTPAGEGK